MKFSNTVTTFLIAVLAMTATSCYTQLKSTYDTRPSPVYNSGQERVVSGDRAVQERSEEIVNEEDYTLGYEDGWTDAEAYYFKDYETQRWYEEYGATLAHDPYARRVIVNNYYGYNRYYSPYYSHYDPFYYHPHSYWSSRWSFSLGFHWGSWYPRHHYSYYAYPGYYPYYGSYWGWGYHRPYYGGVVYYDGKVRGTNRNYGPRSTGLTSRGSETVRRTRSDARVNTATRSAVRTEARSGQVSRSRGTVNRSGDARSSSSVRSRSGNGSSNSRGTVNRSSGSSNSRGSSGTVNRSGSSSNRSSGTVNRSGSSSNRSNGSVNRSSSSSSNRSNGSASRSRNSNSSTGVSSDGVIISRGTSIIRDRSSGNRTSAVSRDQELDSQTRVNRSSAVNNNKAINETSQRTLTNRERSLQSIRNRISQSEVEVPDRNRFKSQTSRSSGSGILNSRAVRNIYNSMVGTNSSNNRSSSSSVSRSSGSSSRSSSVSRSGSGSSSRSAVRSGSNRSSTSKGSSSRSRSSSSSKRSN